MLRRIIAIKNVGRFRNSATTPTHTLSKYVAVFGGNGYGKTTFCAVARSVQSGDTAAVIGRQTLGTAETPDVELLFTDGNRRLRDGEWSSAFPTISVFDGTFVSENVHSGDIVDLANKRNLYRVIIGRAGVELAELEKALTEDGRVTQAELTAAEKGLHQICPDGISLADFIGLRPDPDIDAKIEVQRQVVGALQEAEEIANRAGLVSLPIAPEFELNSILRRSLQTLGDDAESLLSEHLARHNMVGAGIQWIGEGVGYIAEDECPFCGRDGLDSLPLIKAYRIAFDESYSALEAEIADLQQSITASIGEAAVAGLRTLKAENDTALEFWKRHCATQPESFADPDNALADMGKSYEVFAGLLNLKARQPHVPIDRSSALGNAEEALSQARRILEKYNQAVLIANPIIAERKQATAQADLQSAEQQLVRLGAIKLRHEDNVARACDDRQRLDAKKKEIEATKAEVREQLEAHTREVMQPYESRINSFLDMFNADFRLAGTTHGYPGGIATSTYQLLINNRRVDLGDSRTPVDQPSFKNTLSTGDRTTLGLAIFLAQLDREKDLSDRIVIFDDPFSSQDAFRRSQTVYEIMRIAHASAQVIVLSHDAQFLKQLWEKYPTAERSALQITLEPSGSKIAMFDLGAACRGRAAAELDDLIAFRATGAGNLREIIKKLRVVLETHFRLNYPGAFAADDNLGDILRKIRAGGDQHPAHEAYELLERINDYTTTYHHGEDARDAAEPPLDYQELQGYVGMTLRMVNALPG